MKLYFKCVNTELFENDIMTGIQVGNFNWDFGSDINEPH